MAKVWVKGFTKDDGTKVKGHYREVSSNKSADAMALSAETKSARNRMKASGTGFATIWKDQSGAYGFNFDKKPRGYTMTDAGIKRTVVKVLRSRK